MPRFVSPRSLYQAPSATETDDPRVDLTDKIVLFNVSADWMLKARDSADMTEYKMVDEDHLKSKKVSDAEYGAASERLIEYCKNFTSLAKWKSWQDARAGENLAQHAAQRAEATMAMWARSVEATPIEKKIAKIASSSLMPLFEQNVREPEAETSAGVP